MPVIVFGEISSGGELCRPFSRHSSVFREGLRSFFLHYHNRLHAAEFFKFWIKFTGDSAASSANALGGWRFLPAKKLEDVIKRQESWQQITARHHAGADIGDIHAPELAELIGNQMFYAASLRKIAIRLAVFIEIEAGNLKERDELYKEMTRMMRYSSRPHMILPPLSIQQQPVFFVPAQLSR